MITKIAFQESNGKIWELNTRDLIDYSIEVIDDRDARLVLFGDPIVSNDEPNLQVRLTLHFTVTEATIRWQDDPFREPDRLPPEVPLR
jgi:hypothetical protein